jgi:hypothetical protein
VRGCFAEQGARREGVLLWYLKVPAARRASERIMKMLSRDKIHEINDQRLGGWGKILTEQHATAAILLGFGHDARSGEMTVLVPKGGIDLADLRDCLLGAVVLLDEGKATVVG